jgi:hypothetical protein
LSLFKELFFVRLQDWLLYNLYYVQLKI